MIGKRTILFLLLLIYLGILAFVTIQVRGDYDRNIPEVRLTTLTDAVIVTDHVIEGIVYSVDNREHTFQVNFEMGLYQHTGVFFGVRVLLFI